VSVYAEVNKAVREGVLIPQPCEVCGEPLRTVETTTIQGGRTVPLIRRNIHAHHDDYSKPLQVRWLCDLHHREHHRKAAS